MASKSIFVCVAFLMIFCFMLTKQDSTECETDHGHSDCLLGTEGDMITKGFSRKVLGGLKEMMEKYAAGNEKRELYEWELRKVPSGPDPLHHNGKNPKKPRSP